MKKIIYTALIFALFSFCKNENNNIINSSKNKNIPPPPQTILDSLQGRWCIDSACSFGINVNGKNWEEFEVDNGSIVDAEQFRIYFSDTIVNEHYDKYFQDVAIDSTLQKGKYLITVSGKNDMVYCYKFNGFNINGNDTMFSITDVWAKQKPTLYKKNP